MQRFLRRVVCQERLGHFGRYVRIGVHSDSRLGYESATPPQHHHRTSRSLHNDPTTQSPSGTGRVKPRGDHQPDSPVSNERDINRADLILTGSYGTTVLALGWRAGRTSLPRGVEGAAVSSPPSPWAARREKRAALTV